MMRCIHQCHVIQEIFTSLNIFMLSLLIFSFILTYRNNFYLLLSLYCCLFHIIMQFFSMLPCLSLLTQKCTSKTLFVLDDRAVSMELHCLGPAKENRLGCLGELLLEIGIMRLFPYREQHMGMGRTQYLQHSHHLRCIQETFLA